MISIREIVLSHKSTICGAALLVLGSQGLQAQRSPEPPLGARAFLSRHVYSVSELLNELDRDPRLMKVYTSVLHMTPAEVRSEFAKLQLIRLPKTEVYQVYGVERSSKGYQFSYKVRRLPAGIPVLVLKDTGIPVILVQCGNLIRGYYNAPAPSAENVPLFDEMHPDAGLQTGSDFPKPDNLVFGQPSDVTGGWIEEPDVTAPTGEGVPPAHLTSVPKCWWYWLFPLIAIPFLIHGGGGGGSAVFFGTGPFIPPDSGSLAATVEPSIDIPEPTAPIWLGAMTVAGVGLYGWRRAKLVLARGSERRKK